MVPFIPKDSLNVCIESPKESTKMLLELIIISEMNMDMGCQITT